MNTYKAMVTPYSETLHVNLLLVYICITQHSYQENVIIMIIVCVLGSIYAVFNPHSHLIFNLM